MRLILLASSLAEIVFVTCHESGISLVGAEHPLDALGSITTLTPVASLWNPSVKSFTADYDERISLPSHSTTVDCDVLPADTNKRCDWARNCRNNESHIPYEYFYFCFMPRPLFVTPILLLWTAVLCYFMGCVADIYMTSNMLVFVQYFKISDGVAGVTVLAFANAAGDTLMGYWSCFSKQHSIDLYVGDAVGACAFVTLVVFGLVIISVGSDGIRLPSKSTIRDFIFLQSALFVFIAYIVAPNWGALITLSSTPVVKYGDARFFATLFGIYILYVIVVYLQNKFDTDPVKEIQDADAEKLNCPIKLCAYEDNLFDSMRAYQGKNVTEKQSKSRLQIAQTSPLLSWRSPKHFADADNVCQYDNNLTVPTLRYTRTGKRLVSKPDLISHLETRYSVHDCSGVGILHFHAASLLRSSTSTLLDPSATFVKKTFHQLFREAVSVFMATLVAPFELFWKSTIPSPDFSDKLLVWYPFNISILIAINGLLTRSILRSSLILSSGVLFTAVAANFPTIFVKPFRYSEKSRQFVAVCGVVMSVFWNITFVAELVKTVRCIGLVVGLPTQILGLTLVAWGNSLSDLFANVSVARSGHPQMALSGCYGAAIFMSLFGIGSVGLLATFKSSTGFVNLVELFVDGATFTTLRSLSILLPVTCVTTVIVGFHYKPGFGVALVCAYALITTCAVLISY